MNASRYAALGLLILCIGASTASQPVRLHVRYVTAAMWPETFDATPEDMKKMPAGTYSEDVELSPQFQGLTPIDFYQAVFGTNTPVFPLVSRVKVYRFNPAYTNYSLAHSYRYRAMLTDTNFTDLLHDGDVVYFHATVD